MAKFLFRAVPFAGFAALAGAIIGRLSPHGDLHATTVALAGGIFTIALAVYIGD